VYSEEYTYVRIWISETIRARLLNLISETIRARLYSETIWTLRSRKLWDLGYWDLACRALWSRKLWELYWDLACKSWASYAAQVYWASYAAQVWLGLGMQIFELPAQRKFVSALITRSASLFQHPKKSLPHPLLRPQTAQNCLEII